MEHRRWEEGSGVIPVVKFLCCLAKDLRLQPQCKYYLPMAKPGMTGTRPCIYLGNWEDGLQICKCEAARKGYLDAIKKGG